MPPTAQRVALGLPRATDTECLTMDYDADKVDDAVLALMFLTLSGYRSWKGFDWDCLNRLHEKGFIADPRNRAKSVVLTDEGIARSELLFRQLFTASAANAPIPPYWAPLRRER